MNSPLQPLIARLDDLVATHEDTATLASDVAQSIADAITGSIRLEERHLGAAPDRYAQHIVHTHPEGKYSIVSLVWKPGQSTPVHDHRCWCVVGVLQGRERETRYHLIADGADEWLLATGSHVARAGDVSYLVPPAENIHEVANAGDEIAVSLHVYGADIAIVGSSINRVFDLPRLIRAPAHGETIRWRTRDTVGA